MPPDLIPPEDVDTRLGWTPGRASRLARKQKLPHYVLPDGDIRFTWAERAALIRHVTPGHSELPTAAGVARVA